MPTDVEATAARLAWAEQALADERVTGRLASFEPADRPALCGRLQPTVPQTAMLTTAVLDVETAAADES